jgi:hypothetical protein
MKKKSIGRNEAVSARRELKHPSPPFICQNGTLFLARYASASPTHVEDRPEA